MSPTHGELDRLCDLGKLRLGPWGNPFLHDLFALAWHEKCGERSLNYRPEQLPRCGFPVHHVHEVSKDVRAMGYRDLSTRKTRMESRKRAQLGLVQDPCHGHMGLE